MNFLPLFHSLQGRTALVVGGGDVALRKARLLHAAGARLRIVAPSLHAQIAPLATDVHQRSYVESDLDGVVLAIAATNHGALNAAVSAHAQARGIPVNVVDSPALCSVTFPSIVDRSPLMVAVGSGGHAPVLARLARARIETCLPAHYGQLAGLAREFRNKVRARLPGVRQRRIFWEETFQGAVAEAIFAGQPAQARQLLENRLAGAPADAPGEIYLIESGPGDPDLLTFRALRLMQQADAVVRTPSVPTAIADLCRRDADMLDACPLCAGAAPGCAGQLADLARQGKRVTLLIAGNVPLSARTALLHALAAQGVRYQWVPGVGAPTLAPNT
ncbi:NAD(P)-dependent oxidoreductase [Bordetella petrii]|uniref:NAD(P)-dependent oxidoreductase n=1 Tax=Bordetella petrii TaxID=94624 RepID=UPI0004AF824F|nr:NAD(P)-dependent oxidoreductase [Bordetella petrii]